MRPEGWEDRLAAEIEAAQGRPWRWGRHDCVAFALRCGRAALAGPTRWDAAADARAWSTAAEASARLEAGGGLLAIMDSAAPRIDWRFARRGDVVALPGEAGAPCLGVVDLGCAWVAARPLGLTRARLDAALAAWALS